ncbi:MAG TPA: hypothetical protein VNZ67_04435, partial [bacterium]|nr:hypothetical protein [bacterium]
MGAAGWQRLRVRFALLYLAAAIAAVVWLDFLTPLPPAGDPLRVPLLSVYLAGGAALAWRPRWLPALAVAVLPFSALDIFWSAFQAPPPQFPAVLNLLFFVAIAATVFAGPWAGDTFVALLLAGLGLLAWRHPWLHTDYLALKQLSNLALMLAVLHLLLRAYWRRVQQATLQLGLATQALLEHAGQIQALGHVAFQDVRGRMWTLGRVLEQAVPAREDLQKAVTELQTLLQAKRMELGDLAEGPELNASRDGLLALRTRMQGLVLAALGAAFAVALLRNTLQSGFPPGATAAGALFLACAALLHRGSVRWGPWAFRAALFANQWLIFGYDWAHRADQPLLFAANHSVSIFLVFQGALLDAPWAGGALLAGELLAVAVFAWAGVNVGGGMTGVLLGLSLAAAGALWALPFGLLTRLESQRRELILARWHRQRL